MLTELGGNISVLRTHKGPHISDYVAVITQLNVKRCNPERQTPVFRKVKGITLDQWMQAFQERDLTLSDDLDEMVSNLDSTLRDILDQLAPEKKVTVPLKPKQPWYTKDLRTLKCKVH